MRYFLDPEAEFEWQSIVPGFMLRFGDQFMARTRQGAWMRLGISGALLSLYWFLIALSQSFPSVLSDSAFEALPFPINILFDFLASFFAPSVLVFVLPVWVGLWLGFRQGVTYLVDLYELENPSMASEYLLAALFGLGYTKLTIDSGDYQALDQGNWLLRIGGPGYLDVHLGFAAVVETADGHPIVYGTGDNHFLPGFETLRDVVDLRDQIRREDEVLAETKDGVEVYARDVQMVFRVHSGGQLRSLSNPFPYSPAAIRHLVYSAAVTERGPSKWDDALPGRVKAVIRNFVNRLTIEEFIALQPELQILGQDSYQPDSDLPPSRTTEGGDVARRRLTSYFWNPRTLAQLEQAGLELVWVGVGAWEVRDESYSETLKRGPRETLIDTWRNVQKLQLQKDPAFLSRKQEESRQQTLSSLLTALISEWEQQPDSSKCWYLTYRLKQSFETMQASLAHQEALQLPPDFEAVVEHLTQLGRSQILGGPPA
ncbi:MAG: hypothetical protein PVF49_00745 [Anaerolineales bacterium]|jgi:hypothetical protein